ncbi:hypothetical protein KY284_032907 [Solanum tuberosum]|nr:hypothetical protein KY284_032907 [Solanum tuberosum]
MQWPSWRLKMMSLSAFEDVMALFAFEDAMSLLAFEDAMIALSAFEYVMALLAFEDAMALLAFACMMDLSAFEDDVYLVGGIISFDNTVEMSLGVEKMMSLRVVHITTSDIDRICEYFRTFLMLRNVI